METYGWIAEARDFIDTIHRDFDLHDIDIFDVFGWRMHETFADTDELSGAIGDEIGDVAAFLWCVEAVMGFEFFFEDLCGCDATIAEGDMHVQRLEGVGDGCFEDGIVRTAEDECIDLFGVRLSEELSEVLFDDEFCGERIAPAFFDEGDEEGAGECVDTDVRIELMDGAFVGPAVDGGARADEGDMV